MPQIELLKTHTHAGADLGVGTVVDVDDSTANWLIEHGVGQVVAPVEARRSRQSEANPVSNLTPTKE